MRKWNKLLAMLLAMVMVFGMTATALAAEGDADKKEDTPTATAPTEGEDKKDETTAPADGEDKKDETTAPADGEDKKDETVTPAGGEDKMDEPATPADGEDKKDETAAPADGEDKKDETAAPADGEDKKDEPATVTFSDVAEGQWHYEYIQKMVAAGIVEGYEDGTFKPGAALTWGAAAKMAVVFATGEEKAPVEGGSWASGYLAYLKDEGIWTEEIDHNKNISRLEMCQLLAKTLKIAASEKESTFPDTKDGYVVALVELNIIGGNPDGTFDPDGALTRAALCRILASVPDSVKNAEPAAPAEPAGDETAPDADKKDETTPDADKKDETTPDADKKDETAPDADKKDETTPDADKKDETTPDADKKDETTPDTDKKDA